MALSDRKLDKAKTALMEERAKSRAFRDAVTEAYQSTTNAHELQEVIGELLSKTRAREVTIEGNRVSFPTVNGVLHEDKAGEE